MQKNRSKQKGRINKNQNKTKICKGSSRWGKCRLLPLLEGLIASGKYLTGKFAAETHTAMVAMHFLCTQGKQWLFYWMYWKPCRSGFQNLDFFQSLEEEVAGCPLCLVCHSPRAWIWWAILIGLCNVFMAVVHTQAIDELELRGVWSCISTRGMLDWSVEELRQM